MLASSPRTPEFNNRGKRKWTSNGSLSRGEEDIVATNNLQTPQNKRARREQDHLGAHTPFGRVATWIRETARKTVRIFTSFKERYWRDDVDDQVTNEMSLPVYEQTDIEQPQHLGKDCVTQDEVSPLPWRRKPLDENFSPYRRHEPSSSKRTVFNPSRYSSKATTASSSNELWPSSSSQHLDGCAANVSVKRTEARVIKPKTNHSKKPRNNAAFKIKRHPTTVDNVVRLQEREQYMKLLAHYTSSAQPRTIVVEDEHDKDVSSKRSAKSEHLVLSSESLFADPRLPSTQQEFRQPVKLQASPLKMASGETVRAACPNETKGILELQPNNRPSRRSFDLLDDNWIKKWRETLSTDYLEQQRKIAKEKLKLEAIRKEKDDLEVVSKQVKERMLAKQKSPVLEEEVDSFEELTDEMNNAIDKALGHGASNELLVELAIGRITRGDIITLQPQTWLNDEVVNAYFHMVVERSKNSGPKVHAFNTFFYPKLIKTGHAGLRRWTKKVDLFAMDIILIPVHLGMHWCLAVIDIKRKTFTYYDSLKGENKQCILALRDYICAESLDKKKTNLDLTGWKNDSPKNIPEQLNGCDCGVFACKYAEYVSRRATFNFTQHHMPYFRRRMVYEILQKKLL